MYIGRKGVRYVGGREDEVGSHDDAVMLRRRKVGSLAG